MPLANPQSFAATASVLAGFTDWSGTTTSAPFVKRPAIRWADPDSMRRVIAQPRRRTRASERLKDPIEAALGCFGEQVSRRHEIASLAQLAAAARRHGRELSRIGIGAGALSNYLTGVNDLLSRRVIDIAIARFGPAPVPWTWMVMGSQARDEQTFCTDQDNGIIFQAADPAEADRMRQWFLPFAQEINRNLDACGIGLCKGGIMAGNAACCLSLVEWRERFGDWIRSPDPQALLNATIFFDFRAIHGDLELGDQLRREVTQLAPTSSMLLRLMASNALDVNVPIGFFRNFVTDKGRGAERSLDLKVAGVRLFVDAARIMALATSCKETSTALRLRAAGQAFGLAQTTIDGLVQAFECMQTFRMTNQDAGSCDGDIEDCNRIKPARLNSLERKILRGCFEQAKMLQQQIRLSFAREY